MIGDAVEFGLTVFAYFVACLLPFAILAALAFAIWAIDVPHRIRVRRLRRQDRRIGRTPGANTRTGY